MQAATVPALSKIERSPEALARGLVFAQVMIHQSEPIPVHRVLRVHVQRPLKVGFGLCIVAETAKKPARVTQRSRYIPITRLAQDAQGLLPVSAGRTIVVLVIARQAEQNQRIRLVPCTGCRYCRDACPQSLDIPKLISMYNEASFGHAFTLNFTLGAMTEAELPSACLACGECKALCPQDIDIPDIMAKFADIIANMPRMGTPPAPAKPASSAK